MNLASAVTGLPYVGKTTLFNLLTGAHAETGAFAGAEGETNVGVTKVELSVDGWHRWWDQLDRLATRPWRTAKSANGA